MVQLLFGDNWIYYIHSCPINKRNTLNSIHFCYFVRLLFNRTVIVTGFGKSLVSDGLTSFDRFRSSFSVNLKKIWRVNMENTILFPSTREVRCDAVFFKLNETTRLWVRRRLFMAIQSFIVTVKYEIDVDDNLKNRYEDVDVQTNHVFGRVRLAPLVPSSLLHFRTSMRPFLNIIDPDFTQSRHSSLNRRKHYTTDIEFQSCHFNRLQIKPFHSPRLADGEIVLSVSTHQYYKNNKWMAETRRVTKYELICFRVLTHGDGAPR